MVSGHIQYRCDETVVPIPRCIKTPVNRPALVEMQQIYRIILSLYRCIDTKSNRIDTAHCDISIYHGLKLLYIVVNLNGT